MDFAFFLNSILLGVGLAMDAFSVSLANGLNEPDMKKSKLFFTAGVFGFFQALMPLLGWICVHTVVRYFEAFEKFVPWIALLLLGFIGGKMLFEGLHGEPENGQKPKAGLLALLVQGIATSIDALSVGFTIADYKFLPALVCALIIALVTFCICIGGVFLGKKAGTQLSGKASVLGGVILIVIGIEICVTSFL